MSRVKHARFYERLPWGKEAYPACKDGKWIFAKTLADVTCKACIKLLKKRSKL